MLFYSFVLSIGSRVCYQYKGLGGPIFGMRFVVCILYVLCIVSIVCLYCVYVVCMLFVLCVFCVFRRYCVCIVPSFFRISGTVMSWNFSNTSL